MPDLEAALRPRVLVVDRDLPEIRNLVEFLRDQGGFSTVWARDGEARAANRLDSNKQHMG